MTEHPLIPSEAIENLMKKVFEEGGAATGLFWDAFLNANVFIPLSKPKGGEHAQKLAYSPNESIPILLGVDADGGHVIWVFTSLEVMVDYTEQDLDYLSLRASEFLQRVKGNKHDVVLIGPNGITLRLHPGLVASLADGKVPEAPVEEVRHVPKESPIHVGKAIDSAALEARFKTLFSELPDVLEACFIQIEDDAGSRLLLGIQLREETREKLKDIAAVVARAAEGVLDKGKTMDITLLNGSLKEAFAKWGTTFFKR